MANIPEIEFSDIPDVKISLECKDGVKIEMDMRTAWCSITIMNVMTLTDSEGNKDVQELPLQAVESNYMKVVKEWAEHHKDDPGRASREYEISDWDKQLLEKFDRDFLCGLTKSVNFLDIKCLFRVCCQSIADRLKGMNSPEIRRYFDLDY